MVTTAERKSTQRNIVRLNRKDVASQAKRIIAQYSTDNYVAFHSQRYAVLLSLISGYISDQSNVLDIGRSKLTELIGQEFNIEVDTLGFPEDSITDAGKHYHFNLNHAQWTEQWRTDLPKYDLIVMAEVIEHLYTSPKLVLEFLKTLLKPDGVLIVQTPNALAFWKRIKPLLGTHPYELIRETYTDPGHFREYSEQELHNYAKQTGFKVLDSVLGSYFDYRYVSRAGKKLVPTPIGALANLTYRYLPRGLKTDITIVLTPQ